MICLQYRILLLVNVFWYFKKYVARVLSLRRIIKYSLHDTVQKIIGAELTLFPDDRCILVEKGIKKEKLYI